MRVKIARVSEAGLGDVDRVNVGARAQARPPPGPVIQRLAAPGAGHLACIQALADRSPRVSQRRARAPLQARSSQTGLPDPLKSGAEQLSGIALDDVEVHYNSDKPAQMQAHAYAQGTDIHLAPGQEQHLAHEAWHVVQQKQGRVRPTTQMKGVVNLNDDRALETEADVMGAKAMRSPAQRDAPTGDALQAGAPTPSTVQRLAVQYGHSPPIPEDAENIAAAQDDERGAVIPVQMLGANISDDVFAAMGDHETIYIVAHGRAPIGKEPAMLQEGSGAVMSGSEVAAEINTIRTGLDTAGKRMGDVKIEACMSSLSRKTKSGAFGGYFVKPKPSLLSDIQTSLRSTYRVNGVAVRGNSGFSTGNEKSAEGVHNLSPKNTELGLLASILETLEKVDPEAWTERANAALRKDGKNIVRKLEAALTTFHNETQVSELIQGTTVALIRDYLSAAEKLSEKNDEVINVVSMLNGYIREDPA